MAKRRWRLHAPMAFVVAIAGLIMLAQACGGGSASEDASPTATATSQSAAAVASGTPGARPSFTTGAGVPGPGLFVGGASDELATFLGISIDQLQSELDAEGATPASVAEAHGRTREELKTFFTEQQQAQVSEAVAAGTMSQEEADQMLEAFASRIDDVIDGNVPFGGGPGAGGFTPGGGGAGLFIGGPSEELASFLDMSFEELQAELATEGATLASVAEAHGRSRDELKTFLTDQLETQTIEAVVAGTISPDDADAMIERLTSSIDDIIDGKMPSGGFRPAPTPSGQ